jgi:hypothetical protein
LRQKNCILKRKSIGNHERGSRTAENHRETEAAVKAPNKPHSQFPRSGKGAEDAITE